MLKGNVQLKKSTTKLTDKKERLEQQALERFLAASKKKKDPTLFTHEKIMNSPRHDVLEKYDGIAMERILGKSDLFPIAYLQTGLRVGNAVCRLSIRNEKGNVLGYGTGFMVSPHLLMTNNHVLETPEVALHSLAEFNYQDDENFMPCPVHSFRLDPERFFLTNEELDFTLVAIKEHTNQDKKVQDFGYIPLQATAGKILEGEYVSIIQHPKGSPKSVTLRENQVSNRLDHFIHYLTDTEPGSSGSPVFNDQWVLVALHHSGVPHPDKKGDWIANEGIRISSIVNDIAARYHTFAEPQKALLEEAVGNLEDKDTNSKQTKKSGYDPAFLGAKYKVPLPQLSEKMLQDTTPSADGSIVLDYTHFSIVMKKSRGLAYFTAVNIDGNKPVKIPRENDSWQFDPRIDKQYQYGNEVYQKNDLDRGHLVRLLDPCWGKDAKQAHQDTFHFTNSAPQHKNLNQKIWLELEDYVLKNANTHKLKVTVFTGPVFREDDMIYRKKYQIPAEFWKVVVLVKKDGKLSATAYLQTQKNMIDNLEFAYGEYKTYQVPVAKIEQITGLNFGNLNQNDPIATIETSGMQISKAKDIKL